MIFPVAVDPRSFACQGDSVLANSADHGGDLIMVAI
jgi:hypothetical protein